MGRPFSYVGVTGFEPATSSSRTKRATKLRHTPVERLPSLRVRGPGLQNGFPVRLDGPVGYATAVRVSSVASGGQAKRTGA